MTELGMKEKEMQSQKDEAKEMAEMLSRLSATDRCTIRGIVLGVELARGKDVTGKIA